MPDRRPAVRLRARLERHRAVGFPFPAAWALAVEAAAPSPGWREALEETREGWQDAYAGSRRGRELAELAP